MSPGLYLQMAVRGMRPSIGKADCLVLDFAGVVATHGPITAVQPPKKAGEGNGEAPVKVCDACGELCAIAVSECPACGSEFPKPERKKLELRQDDIMGLEGQDMDVSSWNWRKHISKASGKQMLSCTYYGSLSDKPITEYLPIFHQGYAGQRAMEQLMAMARHAGATINYEVSMSEDEGLDYLAVSMSNASPPHQIEFKRDGKFHRVVRRQW